MKISDFRHVKTGRNPVELSDLDQRLASYINSRYTLFSDARQVAEDTWLEAWALYIGTPDAVDYQRQTTLRTVGDVNNDWRHRLDTGKAFQVIETNHAYLMSALFPNNEWFDLTPKQEGYANEARIIRKYLANKFKEGNFRVVFEKYLRQLLVCGYSVMALPWRCETELKKYNVTVNKPTSQYYDVNEKSNNSTKVVETRYTRNYPEFECLDIFDVFIDPQANDPNKGDLLRRIKRTRADVICDIERGIYRNIDPFDVVNTRVSNRENNTEMLTKFQGIDTYQPYRMDDVVDVLEYWGDIHLDDLTLYDVRACVIGDALVSIEPNPFWAGRPFVVGTVTETPKTPYSIGVLQPNMGLLHQLNIITNQRCDNLELAVDEMWTLVANSSLQPEDVYVEPGKIFLVDDHNDLRPVQRGSRDFVVSYQEASFLENTIDSNSGTGNLISANSARSGERVTAAEIQAVRDAGGNRLSNVHQHIEDTTLVEILKRVYRSMQQFVTEPETIRVNGTKRGEYLYYSVDPESINNEYYLDPIGAGHVTDKTKYVRDRLDFIGFASQIPEMASRLNYEELLNDIIQHSGFDDPLRYVKAPQQQPIAQPEQPQLPTNELPTEDPMYDICLLYTSPSPRD
jgi:hypothetical protein